MVLDPNRPAPADPDSQSPSSIAARVVEALRPESGAIGLVARMLWLPACAVVAAIVVDVSVAYRSHARMLDVAREAARLVAGGQASKAQAEIYALSRLPGPASYSIMVAERPSEHGRPDVLVAISTSSNAAGLFGSLRLFDVERLTARHVTRMEALHEARCGEGCAKSPSGG